MTFSSRALALSVLLDEAPGRIAKIMGADVVSVYLLEGHGAGLVMRGNVGFSPSARGQIRLRVGEGLTGLAVDLGRPISVAGAPSHEKFRRFNELSEDQFPVFLAVPVVGHRRPVGALVLQRRQAKPFTEAEIALAVSLTGPISAAARTAHVLDELRERTSRRTGGGTRKVTLPAKPVVRGRAFGGLAALRRPSTTGRGRTGESKQQELKLLRQAFEAVRKDIEQLQVRSRELGLGADASFLTNYELISNDSRLKQRAVELCKGGQSISQALGTVAREAARAAIELVADPYMEERARDLEDFCDAVVMLASPDLRAEVPSKAVLVGDKISVFDVLITARSQPVGIALTELATSPRTIALLKLLGVPSVVDCAGAWRWGSPGDVVLVDADLGFLVINPSRADIATVRAERRSFATPARPNNS